MEREERKRRRRVWDQEKILLSGGGIFASSVPDRQRGKHTKYIHQHLEDEG